MTVTVVVVVSVPVAMPVLLVVPDTAFNAAFTDDVLGLHVTIGAFILDCVVEVSSLTRCACETAKENRKMRKILFKIDHVGIR